MKTQQTSKGRLWTGWIMSALIILFMFFDAAMKFLKSPEVIRATVDQLGYAEHHIFWHGLSGFISTVLYIIPATSVLGAVMLTAHYGGAIASNLRVNNPLFSHTLFPVYIAIIMWGGLWLRNERLRAILPLQRGRVRKYEQPAVSQSASVP